MNHIAAVPTAVWSQLTWDLAKTAPLIMMGLQAVSHSFKRATDTCAHLCQTIIPCGFRPVSQFAPVMQRVNLKDYIAIYTEGVPDDKCHRFRVSTSDADDFSWSPDGTIIAVCDSALHYSVFVYKAADGGCLKRFQLSGKGLGLRALHWTPNSQFLAIGSYDNVCSQ